MASFLLFTLTGMVGNTLSFQLIGNSSPKSKIHLHIFIFFLHLGTWAHPGVMNKQLGPRPHMSIVYSLSASAEV